MEVSGDKILPYGGLVCHCAAFHSNRGALRPQRVCRSGTRGSFTRQKEKQNQEDQEANNFEGPPRQTQPKARLVKQDLRPPKTKTGNLAAPRFSAFGFRRRGADQRLWRYAPRARCDGSCLCSKPGGVNLTSAAFRTTVPFYAYSVFLARAPFRSLQSGILASSLIWKSSVLHRNRGNVPIGLLDEETLTKLISTDKHLGRTVATE